MDCYHRYIHLHELQPTLMSQKHTSIYYVPLQTAAVTRQERKPMVHLCLICFGGNALPLSKALLQPLEKHCT